MSGSLGETSCLSMLWPTSPPAWWRGWTWAPRRGSRVRDLDGFQNLYGKLSSLFSLAPAPSFVEFRLDFKVLIVLSKGFMVVETNRRLLHLRTFLLGFLTFGRWSFKTLPGAVFCIKSIFSLLDTPLNYCNIHLSEDCVSGSDGETLCNLTGDLELW